MAIPLTEVTTSGCASALIHWWIASESVPDVVTSDKDTTGIWNRGLPRTFSLRASSSSYLYVFSLKIQWESPANLVNLLAIKGRSLWTALHRLRKQRMKLQQLKFGKVRCQDGSALSKYRPHPCAIVLCATLQAPFLWVFHFYFNIWLLSSIPLFDRITVQLSTSSVLEGPRSNWSQNRTLIALSLSTSPKHKVFFTPGVMWQH